MMILIMSLLPRLVPPLILLLLLLLLLAQQFPVIKTITFLAQQKKTIRIVFTSVSS